MCEHNCRDLVAFHPRPQIASDLGRNVTRSSNPHLKSQAIPERERNFVSWPQIQIAAGLNPLRFETRKPNPPLEKTVQKSPFFASMKNTRMFVAAANPQPNRRRIAHELRFVNDMFTVLYDSKKGLFDEHPKSQTRRRQSQN